MVVMNQFKVKNKSKHTHTHTYIFQLIVTIISMRTQTARVTKRSRILLLETTTT
jgi:hypothetical protein